MGEFFCERVCGCLFADDFDEDAVGEGRVAEEVDRAVFGEAAEHGVCFGVGVGWSFAFLGGWGCFKRSFSARSRSSGFAEG